MSLAPALKSLTRHEPLSEEAGHRALGALLDGGVPDLEAGALLGLLDAREAEPAELSGYAAALKERCFGLRAPPGPPRPVVFASYTGTADTPNLLALLASTLHRLKLPVVVHGPLSVAGRVLAGQVLRELGVLPAVTLQQAQRALDAGGIACVPTAVLAPGLAHLLALRPRLGFGAFAEGLGRFIDPFGGEALIVLAAADEQERRLLRCLLRERVGGFLLLEASHGDAFADARRRPAIELIRDGSVQLLFGSEAAPMRGAISLPRSSDARTTAAWTQSVLRGECPMPLPLVNQVACCLYGAGYTVDMNQAKAIAAVQTGSLLAA